MLWSIANTFCGQLENDKLLTNDSEKSECRYGVLKLVGNINFESAELFIKKTIAFAQDETIKGVLLIANSGGGISGVSECIFREIKQLAARKSVVVFIPSDCCSGAYWSIVGAHWIIATATAAVGNIGVYRVIEKHTNVHCNDKNTGYTGDASFEIISAGKYKKAPLFKSSSLDSDERAYLQNLTKEHHNTVCASIAQERNLPFKTEDIDNIEWASGKEFSGTQALKLGLIDQIGGFSDSVKELAKLMQENGESVEKLVAVE
jgi:protease-4